MIKLIQFLLLGLQTGGVYALLTVGFVIIYKSTKVLNFAYGEMVALGGYFAIIGLVQLNLPIWAGLLVALLLSLLLGAVINHFLIRPMIGQPLIAVVMITIALASVFSAFTNMVWGRLAWRFPRFIPAEGIDVAGVNISLEATYTFIVAAVVLILLSIFFRFSRMGLIMRTVAEDHQVAKSMGANVNLTFLMTWILASAICGIAGIFLGHFLGVSHVLGLLGLAAIPAAFIGGLESLPGAVVAGLLLGITEGLAAGYIDPIVGAGLSRAFPYLALIIFITFKPYGLFGLKRIERI